jgi:ribonuclease I
MDNSGAFIPPISNNRRLWPQYNQTHSGHDWPQVCSDPYSQGALNNFPVFHTGLTPPAPFCQFCHEDNATYWNEVAAVDPGVESSFQTEWTKYAPAYLGDLVSHEWKRHGSCYSPAVGHRFG